jgi:Holliday junction resolvase
MSGNYERDLANHLDECGYHVMRAPSSGGGTTRELPDLFWAKATEMPVAAELKTTKGNVAYYDSEEVESLKNFAAAFSAQARLVARYKQDTTFYTHRVTDARRTDSGRYAVDRDITPQQEITP